MAQTQVDSIGVKIQNQQDGHLIKDCPLWKFEKAESQSDLCSAHTSSIQGRGVGQIILITSSCHSLPAEEIAAVAQSCSSSELLHIWTTYHRTHCWYGCLRHLSTRRRPAWSDDQKNLLSSPYTPGSPNSIFNLFVPITSASLRQLRAYNFPVYWTSCMFRIHFY